MQVSCVFHVHQIEELLSPILWMYMYTCTFMHIALVCVVHAAVMAINEVLEKEDSQETLKALQNPAACLVDVQAGNALRYQVTLLAAKRDKTAKAGAQVTCTHTHVHVHVRVCTYMYVLYGWIINPWCACAARVTVLGLCVLPSVRLSVTMFSTTTCNKVAEKQVSGFSDVHTKFVKVLYLRSETRVKK